MEDIMHYAGLPVASMSDLEIPIILPSDLLKPNSRCRQQLLTHIRLLHLLYHRNKNQHRRSLWFRRLASFRREVTRFCIDLGIVLEAGLCEDVGGGKMGEALTKNHAVGSSKRQQSRRQKQADVAAPGERQARAEASRKAIARLRHWMHGKLVHKWYIAITTLTATPSFSPLSLTLLAIFARILSLTGATAALTAVADHAEETQRVTEEAEMNEALARFATEDAPALFESLDQGPKDILVDVGVPVAREETRKPSTLKKRRRHHPHTNAIDALFQGL